MKITLFIMAISMIFAIESQAKICKKCKGRMMIMSIGKCKECGARTSSGAKKYCPKCSEKLGRCELCTKKLDDKTSKKNIILKLNRDANGKTIKVGLGQKIEIALAGNPTAGFAWHKLSQSGEAVTISSKLKYKIDKHALGMVGGGGKYGICLVASKTGKSSFEYSYNRAWEKDKLPVADFKITFEVTGKKEDSKQVFSAKHDKKSVTIKKGEKFIITLKGTPGTGYAWSQCKMSGVEVKTISKLKFARADNSGILGGAGAYEGVYQINETGKSSLVFEYKRPWEKDKKPAKTFTINFISK